MSEEGEGGERRMQDLHYNCSKNLLENEIGNYDPHSH